MPAPCQPLSSTTGCSGGSDGIMAHTRFAAQQWRRWRYIKQHLPRAAGHVSSPVAGGRRARGKAAAVSRAAARNDGNTQHCDGVGTRAGKKLAASTEGRSCRRGNSAAAAAAENHQDAVQQTKAKGAPSPAACCRGRFILRRRGLQTGIKTCGVMIFGCRTTSSVRDGTIARHTLYHTAFVSLMIRGRACSFSGAPGMCVRRTCAQ